MKQAKIRYRGIGFLALAVAALAYGYGVVGGHLLEFRAVSEYCPSRPPAYPSVTWHWLPLTNRCQYTNGSSHELVPGAVNPVFFGCLAVAAVCLVLGLRTAWRRRGATSSGGTRDIGGGRPSA